MNLRLLTHRQIAPPRPGATGSWVGYRDLGTCAECDAASDSEQRKEDRGCPYRGLRLDASRRWRVDFTSAPEDWLDQCPVSLRDPGTIDGLARAFEVEALGGLGAVYGRPVYHLPERVVLFYRAALAARDRLSAEVDDTAARLTASAYGGAQ